MKTERVEESEGGVITPTGETSVFTCKFVAIATGHHAKPKIATFPGQDSFQGKIIAFLMNFAFFPQMIISRETSELPLNVEISAIKNMI